MFKVIIAGGRDFDNYPGLKTVMDKLLSNKKRDKISIVCGMADGADKLGERYALDSGYDVIYYPADWGTYGKAAGIIRNELMAKNANALVAFWDGKSCGTKDMIDRAVRHGLSIRVKRYQNPKRTDNNGDDSQK